jgi:hypothetical protein
MGVCAQYTGYRNGLAHALQDSIVGSDSGTPKLPRSTLPVLRSTVPVVEYLHTCEDGLLMEGAAQATILIAPSNLLTCMKTMGATLFRY